MKKASFIIFSIISYVATSQVDNYEVGDVIDDFTVIDTNGVPFNLYDATGSGAYVFLDFFFDSCTPCQITQPIWNEFHDKYGCNEGGIRMISINNGTDTNAEVIAFENEYGGTFIHSPAVGIEGGCSVVDENFGIIGYPAYILISPENQFVDIIEGFIPHTVSDFEALFPEDFSPPVLDCTLDISTLNVTDIVIYPNPVTNNSFHILLPEYIEESKLTIYDAMGKNIISELFSSNTIEITEKLPMGIYFLEVVIENNIFIKKMIVK